MFMCEKYMSNKDTVWDYDVPMHQQATKDLGLVRRFPGVYIREIKDLERVFDLDIYIYQATEDGKKIKLVYFPNVDGVHTKHKPMHLLFLTPGELLTQGEHFGTGHFVCITEWRTLCKCYVCTGCNMNFTTAVQCWKHMRHTCTRKVNGRRDVFPGTISKTHCSLVEKLFRVGIAVVEELLYFKHFITFDFESLFHCYSPAPWWMMGKVERQKCWISIYQCQWVCVLARTILTLCTLPTKTPTY